MCILIAVIIKKCFINVAAGNGPKVESDRARSKNRRHVPMKTRTHARGTSVHASSREHTHDGHARS